MDGMINLFKGLQMNAKQANSCLPEIDKQKFITLTLTNSCNLNCSYCYEHSKTSNGMSFSVAKTVLERELNANNQFEHINIEFFGGEPFIEFNLMQQIISFLRDKHFNKSYTINITTNGTLIHNEIQKWLIDNRDLVSCGLSWDGTFEMQNKNRSHSASLVDLDFFVKLYPDRPIKMTISPDTISTLADGVIFAHKKGFQVFCNLAYGPNWEAEKYCTILERELMKLIDFYLNNPDVPPCSILYDRISQIVWGQDVKSIRSWCAAGTQTCAYDINGESYPCQFFMPLSSGENAKREQELFFVQDVPIESLDVKCQSCVIKTACPTCYGYNYSQTGNIYQRDNGLCKLTKLIIKARSYFLSKLWEQDRLHLDENEEQALLRSIVIIQDNL